MEIISFIDPQSGKTLYCIGPFSEKAAASRASAAIGNQAAQPRKRPQGPITAKCWAIFDMLSPKLGRAELIKECERQGIAKGTAGAQYSRWSAASNRS